MNLAQRLKVQKALAARGLYKGAVDGIFGPATVSAIREYQRSAKLVIDGIVGAKTWFEMFEAKSPVLVSTAIPFYRGKAKLLEPDDLARIAIAINVETAALGAVTIVEAGAHGFDAAGRVTALYEPHICFRMAPAEHKAKLVSKGLAYAKWGFKPYPKSANGRFEQIEACTAIAGEELAADSTSWGIGQIMGFNAQSAGYVSAVAMVRAFADDEENQLAAMAAFIMNNSAIYRALKRKDWAGFAEGYNGASYRKNSYDRKLADAYKRLA